MAAQRAVLQEVAPPAYVRETLQKLDAWGVTVADIEGVVGYLVQHPDVVAALLKAAEEARKRFPEAQLVLTRYEGIWSSSTTILPFISACESMLPN